jgi:hypothetical protein
MPDTGLAGMYSSLTKDGSALSEGGVGVYIIWTKKDEGKVLGATNQGDGFRSLPKTQKPAVVAQKK